MATRGPPGARGLNSRFAQFKLVLLGRFLVCDGAVGRDHGANGAMQENRPLAKYGSLPGLPS
jgi:hypothetical protein